MNKRRFSIIIVASFLALSLLAGLVSCTDKEYDSALPSFREEDGWYQTYKSNFDEMTSADDLWATGIWKPARHGKRNYEYWCDKMISVENGEIVINSERRTDHECDVCGVTDGVFTGGIVTTDYGDGGTNPFEQAYGYFEAMVRVPRGRGMWSAFWLYTNGCTKVGNDGADGSEIDIYESSFGMNNPTKTGNAIHYDAYSAPWYRLSDNVTDVGVDQYDGGYYKYALKWTPEYYVFYFNDTPIWTTDFGVSTVPGYLKLTVEIRDQVRGPYGEEIGRFENHDDDTNKFYIKSVNVWQNSNYEEFINSPADYKDYREEYDAELADWEKMKPMVIGLSVTGSVISIAAVAVVIIYYRKKKAKTN